jgi:hypothetical protein
MPCQNGLGTESFDVTLLREQTILLFAQTIVMLNLAGISVYFI